MDANEINRMAYTGAELPANLGSGKTLLFLMLRAMYDYHKRQENIDAEQVKRERSQIFAVCKKHLQDQEYIKAMGRRNQAIEWAITSYRKAGSPDEALVAADRLIEALDGVPVHRNL